MARYRRPPDPRDPEFDNYREQSQPGLSPIGERMPWRWLGMGVVVTIVGVVIIGALVLSLLVRKPLSVSLPTPTIIRLGIPDFEGGTATPLLPTATPIPTFTPPPTPDLSIAPETITSGYYAQVANTDNIGVSLRGGPSTDNIRLELVPEGEVILVIGGPQEGSGFVWWQVKLADGTEGWVAGDFLVPAAAPQEIFSD